MHKSFCLCEGTGKWEGRDCPMADSYKNVVGFKIRIDGIPFQGIGWIIHFTDKDGNNIDECSKEFAQYLGHNISNAVSWGKSKGLIYHGLFDENEEE